MKPHFLACAAAAAMTISVQHAGCAASFDWPQRQGPERTDKPAWSHPVIANGKLYIRDQDTLFCYDVKAKETTR